MHPFQEGSYNTFCSCNIPNLFFAGVAGATAGTLSFLVGGTEQSFTIAHPILSLMGQRIIHCGSSGAGLAAKICNNVFPFSHVKSMKPTHKFIPARARRAADCSCRSHVIGPVSGTESCSPCFCNQQQYRCLLGVVSQQPRSVCLT